MSGERIETISLDSLIERDSDVTIKVEPVKVGPADYSRHLIRSGELPADVDPVVAEVATHFKEADELYQSIDQLLSVRRQSTEQQIDQIDKFGKQYFDQAERIVSEIDELLDSLVDFMVNSTYDTAVRDLAEKLYGEAKHAIKELHQQEQDLYNSAANIQIELAKCSKEIHDRAHQKYEQVQEILVAIDGSPKLSVEADEVKLRRSSDDAGITNLDQYVEAVEGGATVEDGQFTDQSADRPTSLSDHQRLVAKQVCPELLADYDQILVFCEAANRSHEEAFSVSTDYIKQKDQTIEKRKRLEAIRDTLREDAGIGQQKHVAYGDKHNQMVEMINVLNSNLSLGDSYRQQAQLEEYPSVYPVFTAKLDTDKTKFNETDISTHIGCDVSEWPQVFGKSLERGELPELAAANPYAEGILVAFKSITAQRAAFVEMAADLKADTMSKISKVRTIYGRDATILEGYLDDIGQSGSADSQSISRYLLELALNHDETCRLMESKQQELASESSKADTLTSWIDSDEAALRAASDKQMELKIESQNLDRAIRKIESDYEAKKAEYSDQDYKNVMKGPDINDEEGVTKFMTNWESTQGVSLDTILGEDFSKKSMQVANAQRHFDSVQGDLAENLRLQDRLKNRLVENRYKLNNTQTVIAGLTEQIASLQAELVGMMNDGKYERAVVRLKTAEAICRGIRKDYGIAEQPQTEQLQPVAVEEPKVEAVDTVTDSTVAEVFKDFNTREDDDVKVPIAVRLLGRFASRRVAPAEGTVS